MDEVVYRVNTMHGLVERAYVEYIAVNNLRGRLAVLEFSRIPDQGTNHNRALFEQWKQTTANIARRSRYQDNRATILIGSFRLVERHWSSFKVRLENDLLYCYCELYFYCWG